MKCEPLALPIEKEVEDIYGMFSARNQYVIYTDLSHTFVCICRLDEDQKP